MRLCKFHFSMAMARIKPPIYRNTYLCPNDAVVTLSFIAPVIGNRIIGSMAVTAMGTTSKIHQIATQNVVANTAFASLESLSG